MSLSESLTAPLRVRPLTVADVSGLTQIQAACYDASFLENSAVFERRLACLSQCSIGAVNADDSALQAYLVAYWSQLGQVTPFNGDFSASCAKAPVLYLHDMSVRPALAGQGIARHLLEVAAKDARARGIRQVGLVSVQGSQSYWRRHGFTPFVLNDVEQQNHLSSYGDDACYMVAQL